MNIAYFHVNLDQQLSVAKEVKAVRGILLTLWVTLDREFCVLYWVPEQGLYCVISTLSHRLPDLSIYFPVAKRLQRALYDLTRVVTKNSSDRRPWLNHGYTPVGVLSQPKEAPRIPYRFQKVVGEGVHEVAVGPVHAGIIEPGHFRFSVVGEQVLALETRLGYAHKGIHALLRNQSIEAAVKIAGRVSGDSTVAYALAFALACESVLPQEISDTTVGYRQVLLERERLANHIGDIGAMVNDCSMPSIAVQFSVLKEQLLRHNQHYTGHRYAMDSIIPLVNQAWCAEHLTQMLAELTILESELQQLEKLCALQGGLQDRWRNTGILSPELAAELGVVGVVAKASGISLDLRNLSTQTIASSTAGDVAARVQIRFQECFTSIALIRQSISQPQSEIGFHVARTSALPSLGIGCVEGWRGPVIVALQLDAEQKIRWAHCHDPSWQNWPALEQAVLGNIIADFPLINKSFNLSYSGHDM